MKNKQVPKESRWVEILQQAELECGPEAIVCNRGRAAALYLYWPIHLNWSTAKVAAHCYSIRVNIQDWRSDLTWLERGALFSNMLQSLKENSSKLALLDTKDKQYTALPSSGNMFSASNDDVRTEMRLRPEHRPLWWLIDMLSALCSAKELIMSIYTNTSTTVKAFCSYMGTTDFLIVRRILSVSRCPRTGFEGICGEYCWSGVIVSSEQEGSWDKRFICK